MDAAPEIAALRRQLAAAEARADAMAAEAAQAKAAASSTEALIAHLRLEIEKLRRQLYGQRSERNERLLEQMELQLDEIEATASEDADHAQTVARTAGQTPPPPRRRLSRKPLPAHLPRERVVIEAPCRCGACGSDRIAKLGEDVTETLEVVPRSWKVIQTVREKFPGASPVHASKRPLDALPLRGPALTLPRLRADQPGPGAVPPDDPRLGRAQPARARHSLEPMAVMARSSSRSLGSTNGSTARRSATPSRAWTSASRRWPTRWARPPPRWRRCTR